MIAIIFSRDFVAVRRLLIADTDKHLKKNVSLSYVIARPEIGQADSHTSGCLAVFVEKDLSRLCVSPVAAFIFLAQSRISSGIGHFH